MVEIGHDSVRANGVTLHVARAGEGPPLVLLHGWPEFWLTWEPVMARLARRFTLIAPDLRGFGASDKPVPYEWTDRLGETFSDLDLAPFEGAGHFPHRERPDEAAEAIAGFFSGLPA